jgi:O-antigen/teichoic acid export membrane protein
MLVGALAVYVGWGGLELALHSFWIGVGMATAASIVSTLPKVKTVYKNATGASYEFGTLMRYAVPLSVTSMLFRLNLWMDIIMLGFLSDTTQVGLYKITSALAMLAGIPVSALASIFNPIISEHIERKDLTGLNTLLKTVTRWLIIISIPILLAMLLLTDLVLLPFDPAYMAGEPALMILLVGQVSWIACAPAMRIVPMSGHSMLNLVSSSVAALLNIGLNVLLIPEYGAIGAAIATASTLFSWSIWRLAEVWWISKCFPFDRHTLLLLVFSTALTLGLTWAGHDLSLKLNILCAILVLGAFYAYSVFRLLEPSDMAIGQQIKSKLMHKFSRKSRKG